MKLKTASWIPNERAQKMEQLAAQEPSTSITASPHVSSQIRVLPASTLDLERNSKATV